MIDIRKFRADLRILERLIVSTLLEQSDCCGVTPAQCHLILELEGAGCVNLTTLASRMELDKSTLSRSVDGLVQSGLVNRDTDPENRRQQIICLSDAGKLKAQAFNDLCDGQYRQLFAKIPADRAAVVCEGVALLAAAMSNERSSTEDCCHECN